MIEKDELIKLFNGAKEYIEQGISVVPINDDTGVRMIAYSNPNNTPDTKNPDTIFKLLSNSKGNVKLALITGELSKNLECIDIDEKYKPGISAEYLGVIKEYYPEIYDKLRIEKTKNNGLHIYYTLDKSTSQAKDVAKRLATPEELQEKPKQKTYAFIEVKGNNSSFTCYPSKGYTLLQDKPIPHLTQEERDTLVNIAISFNEVIEKVVEVKVSKKALRNYSTNPWEDYNSDEESFLNLLEKQGWTVASQNQNEIRYARPEHAGKKWVSACYYRNKQLFVIFSSSSNIDAGNYKPSTLLCEWNFNGDKKECFAWLIENSYGKLNKQYETKLIEKAIVNRLPLPKNISKEAREEYELKKNDFENKYPHGLFWEQTEEKGEVTYRINRELILRVATNLGFKIYRGDFVIVEDKILKKITLNDFYNALKSYVKEDEDTNIIIYDKFENYIQQSGKFLYNRLPIIQESEILHDNYNVCYKAFSNVILKITKRGVEEIEWSKIDKYIEDKRVIDYDYKKTEEKGLFVDFVKKAIVDQTTIRKKIGHAVHFYNDSIDPYFMVLLDSVKNPKDGGGSGKNLFSYLVGMMTTYLSINGAHAKADNTLLQPWNSQGMFVLSDVPEKFKYGELKNVVSNSATVKKLYQNLVEIHIRYLPKIWVLSNYSFEVLDGGAERRIRAIEFTDFFTKTKGVARHYNGIRFPQEGLEDDWTDEDWDGYYNYMVNCIVSYLKDTYIEDVELTESGWIKQFCINHGENTYDFIIGKIEYFKKRQFISQSEFQEIYDNFCNENGISSRFRKSKQGLNDALEEYCLHYGIYYNKSKNKSVNSVSTNCRWFGDGEIDDAGNDDDLPF